MTDNIGNTESPPETPAVSPAEARKRRIERRNKQRMANNSTGDEDEGRFAAEREAKRPRLDSSSSDSGDSVSKPTSGESIHKKQARYQPGVPMSKEDLAVWRKEARRVRNRESAAASRKKTRERIEELEAEVELLKTRYGSALARIVELESAAAAAGSCDLFTPDALRSHRVLHEATSALPLSPSAVSSALHASVTPPSTPPLSPRGSLLCSDPPHGPSFRLDDEDKHQEVVSQKYQHIMELIRRPLARGTILKIRSRMTPHPEPLNYFFRQ